MPQRAGNATVRRRVLTFAPLLAVISALAFMPASVDASGYSGNLLADPGGEAVTGSINSEAIVAPPDWSVTGEFTAVKYGIEGGFPTLENSKAVEGGANFFAGGNSEVSTATQTVSVAAYASAIATGSEPVTLSADLGGYSSQGDNATVTATFLSASNASLGSLTIGPVTAAERKEETELLPKSASATVPVETTSIQVVVTSTRVEGEYDDGYSDNISLTLGTPTAPLFGSTGVVTVPSNNVCLSKRAFTIHIRQIPGLTYKRVTVYVNGHSVSVSTGAKLSAPVNLRGLPKGRYTVKITVLTSAGKTITGTRTYRTCVPKKR